MYNRYIPQPDGSYRRNRVPEPRHDPPPVAVRQEHHHEAPKPEVPCNEPCETPNFQPPQPPASKKPQGSSVEGFLRQLLPKDFDTGDLMVILLLLLMAGDCAEDHNTALLTLALYLFM